MGTLRELSQRIKTYANGKAIENEIMEFIKRDKSIYLDIQKDQIHNQRVDREGNPFGQYKGSRNRIASTWQRRNQKTSLFRPQGNMRKMGGTNYNLLYTGDFSDKMTLWVRQGTIVVTSRSPHMKGMMRNPNIKSKKWFGLTEQNENRFARRLGQHAARWIVNGIADG